MDLPYNKEKRTKLCSDKEQKHPLFFKGNVCLMTLRLKATRNTCKSLHMATRSTDSAQVFYVQALSQQHSNAAMQQ